MKVKHLVTAYAGAAMLFVGVVCTMSLTSDEEIGILYDSYYRTTQDYDTAKLEVFKETLNKDENTPVNPDANNPNVPGIPEVNATTWLNICDQVHKAWGASGFTYTYGGYTTYTDSNDVQHNVRLDCSGYVGFCMYTAGFADAPTPIDSRADLTDFGFSLVAKAGTSYALGDLKPGDVLAYSGHIEVYAGDSKIYNWGSASSTSDLYANGAMPERSTVDLSRDCSTLVSVFRPPAVTGAVANLPVDEMTIFIDAGHGCTNTSSSADGREWGTAESRPVISVGDYSGDEHTWAVSYTEDLKEQLQARGFTVVTVYDYGRTYENTGNSGRAKLFNQSPACVMLQVHWNAVSGVSQTSASGFLCCVDNDCPQKDQIKALADCIKASVEGKPLSTRNHVALNLAVMNNAEKPVALLECGFGDNPNDRAVLENHDQRVVQQTAIIDGVVNYLSSN